jgi:hypothetical protein
VPATSPDPAPAGQRVRFLDAGGQRLILLDFAGITDSGDGIDAAAEAKAFIARLAPDGSHYTLTDVRRTRYDRRIVEAFKELTVHNRPYVRAAAIVSDSALHRAAISMIAIVSRRRLEVFATREAAIRYLAEQHREATTG